MKAFIVACLAVAVMADPLMYYNQVPGYPVVSTGLPVVSPLVNTPYVSSPLVSSYIQPTLKLVKEQEKKMEEPKVETYKVEEKKTVVEQPIVYTSGIVPTQYIQGSPIVKPIALGPRIVSQNGEVKSILHKREADPLTVISPYTTYNPYVQRVLPTTYVQSPMYAGIVNKAKYLNPFTGDSVAEVSNDAWDPTPYAGKNLVRTAPGTATTHITKREADPLMVYNNGFVNPLINPVMPVTYMNPYVASPVKTVVTRPVIQPLVKSMVEPIVKDSPSMYTYSGVEGVVNGKTVADDAFQFTPNYAAKGQYEAQTPGTKHVAKREADPLVYYPSTYGLVRPTTYVSRPIVRSSFYTRPIYSGLRYF